MPPAPAPSSYLDTPPLRRRLTGASGALLLTALLLLMLFTLAPPFDIRPPAQSGLSSFGLLPEAVPHPSPSRTKTQTHHAQVTKAAHAVERTPKPPHTELDTSQWPADMIEMSHQDFAATDIAKLPQHERPQQSADAGAKGSANGTSSGHGQGPGGEQLYDVDWYRRPTSAELNPYLPKTIQPDGWGEIICRTAPRYTVDDCHILGESPAGSGYGRAVLDASWQFKVQPPRLGDKALTGAWVRIRITYGLEGDELVGSAR